MLCKFGDCIELFKNFKLDYHISCFVNYVLILCGSLDRLSKIVNMIFSPHMASPKGRHCLKMDDIDARRSPFLKVCTIIGDTFLTTSQQNLEIENLHSSLYVYPDSTHQHPGANSKS